MRNYYVYIFANKNLSVFYTGITNDLVRRVFEHKSKLVIGFTSRCSIDQLLYFEIFTDPETAISREKQIKKYSQKKKINLIIEKNPYFKDLYDDIIK